MRPISFLVVLLAMVSAYLSAEEPPKPIRVKFLPDLSVSELPPGWIGDSGAVLGPRQGGTVYGWREELGTGAEESGRFLYDGYVDVPRMGIWSMVVPNGYYLIRMVVDGRASHDRAGGVFRVEGRVTRGTAVGPHRAFSEAVVAVEVDDGRLDVTVLRGIRLSQIHIFRSPAGRFVCLKRVAYDGIRRWFVPGRGPLTRDRGCAFDAEVGYGWSEGWQAGVPPARPLLMVSRRPPIPGERLTSRAAWQMEAPAQVTSPMRTLGWYWVHLTTAVHEEARLPCHAAGVEGLRTHFGRPLKESDAMSSMAAVGVTDDLLTLGGFLGSAGTSLESAVVWTVEGLGQCDSFLDSVHDLNFVGKPDQDDDYGMETTAASRTIHLDITAGSKHLSVECITSPDLGDAEYDVTPAYTLSGADASVDLTIAFEPTNLLPLYVGPDPEDHTVYGGLYNAIPLCPESWFVDPEDDELVWWYATTSTDVVNNWICGIYRLSDRLTVFPPYETTGLHAFYFAVIETHRDTGDESWSEGMAVQATTTANAEAAVFSLPFNVNVVTPDNSVDSDFDYVPDATETAMGGGPGDGDYDDDGMPDALEYWYGLKYNVPDAAEDADGDTVSNYDELSNYDWFYAAEPDAFSDWWAFVNSYRNRDLSAPTKLSPDRDRDGMDDDLELHTKRHVFPELNLVLWDTDQDMMKDGYEVEYGLDPTDDADRYADTDGDGADNWEEFVHSSRPDQMDTDGDGVDDGTEIAQGSDPVDMMDSQTPEADEILEIPLTVGDWSGSNSERWVLKVGNVLHQDDGFGTPGTASYKFRRGRSYPISVQWVATRPGDATDYDYQAKVDGQCGQDLIVGDGYIVEDPDGLLVATANNVDRAVVEAKMAWLHVLPVLELAIPNEFGAGASKGGIISVSDPHPVVRLTELVDGDLTIDGGSVRIPLAGTIRDGIADNAPASAGAAIESVSVYLDGQVLAGPVAVSQGSDGSPSLWRQHPYLGTFDLGTVDVPLVMGTQYLRVESSSNRAGRTGSDEISLTCILDVQNDGTPVWSASVENLGGETAGHYAPFTFRLRHTASSTGYGLRLGESDLPFRATPASDGCTYLEGGSDNIGFAWQNADGNIYIDFWDPRKGSWTTVQFNGQEKLCVELTVRQFNEVLVTTPLDFGVFFLQLVGDTQRNGTPAYSSKKVCPVRYGSKDKNGDLFGALVLPNRDVDTGDYFDRNSKVDGDDAVINGTADLDDLAPLHLQRVLLAEADMPDDLQCHVKLMKAHGDSLEIPIAERARVWDRIATDATVLVGGPGGSTTFVYDRADPAHAAFFARIAGSGDPLVLGVEGLYPGAPFVVRIEFHQPAGTGTRLMANAYECVNMRCSPFILANNTCAVDYLHLSTYIGDADWERFRAAFAPALDADQIEERPSLDGQGSKYYVQDCAEIGAVALTDSSGAVTRSMRLFGLIEHRLSLESRIGPDVGGTWLGIGDKNINNAPRWEMGGNIECLPPFGKFEHGLLLTDSHLKGTDVFMSFMKAQAVQVGPRGHCLAPVLDGMGYAHIDEFVCVYADGDDWGIMVADFQLGIDLLDANRGVATDGPNSHVPSIAKLVAEYVEPVDPVRREELDRKLDHNSDEIEQIEVMCGEIGIPVVRVPVLPHFAGGNFIHGGLPNSVNGLVMGSTRHVPDPWFQPFMQSMENRGIGGTWQWEDTIGYWLGGGQIHCGTNAERGLEAMVVP